MPHAELTAEAIDDSVEPERPRHPFLFLVLEASRPTVPGARFDLDQVSEVAIGRGARGHERVRGSAPTDRLALVAKTDRLSITFPDPSMSSQHARLHARGGGWWLSDLGSRNGSKLNGEKVVAERRLADGDLLELGGACFIFRSGLPAVRQGAADHDAAEQPASAGLDTLLPGLADELATIARIATSAVSVILRGETGVGKEVVARAIHTLSGRRGAFVAVNCGAIPESLVESELFGHRKGAFSGALADRPGFVRSAEGGTLSLDEIGDMRAGAQTALLCCRSTRWCRSAARRPSTSTSG